MQIGFNIEKINLRLQWVFCVPQTTVKDFVFVKKTTIDGEEFWDVIIADTKLTSSTNLTPNQNKAQDLTHFYVKASTGKDIKDVLISGFTSSDVTKTIPNIIIIYSNGRGGFGDIKQ